MNSWQEHIEAAEQALADAWKAGNAEVAHVARDIAVIHLDIAQFIQATEAAARV